MAPLNASTVTSTTAPACLYLSMVRTWSEPSTALPLALPRLLSTRMPPGEGMEMIQKSTRELEE